MQGCVAISRSVPTAISDVWYEEVWGARSGQAALLSLHGTYGLPAIVRSGSVQARGRNQRDGCGDQVRAARDPCKEYYVVVGSPTTSWTRHALSRSCPSRRCPRRCRTRWGQCGAGGSSTSEPILTRRHAQARHCGPACEAKSDLHTGTRGPAEAEAYGARAVEPRAVEHAAARARGHRH